MPTFCCAYISFVRIFFALMHHSFLKSIALLHFRLRLCSDLHVNCDVAINRRYFTCLDRCVVFVVVCVSKSPFSFLCTIYCTHYFASRTFLYTRTFERSRANSWRYCAHCLGSIPGMAPCLTLQSTTGSKAGKYGLSPGCESESEWVWPSIS